MTPAANNESALVLQMLSVRVHAGTLVGSLTSNFPIYQMHRRAKTLQGKVTKAPWGFHVSANALDHDPCVDTGRIEIVKAKN